MRLSFSKYTHYKQCPYRLLLMHLPERKFLPQFGGTAVHIAVENFLLGKPLSREEIYEEIAYESDGIFDEWKQIWDMLNEIPFETIYQNLQPLFGFEAVEIEKKVSVQYDGITITGVADAVMDKRRIVDFKYTYKDAKAYSFEQMLLYSWLLHETEGYNVDTISFVFIRKNGAVEIVDKYGNGSFTDNKELKRILKTMKRIAEGMEADDKLRHFPPNPLHYTCHHKRCGWWEYCDMKTIIRGELNEEW